MSSRLQESGGAATPPPKAGEPPSDFLQSVLGLSADLVLVVDEFGVLTFASRASERVLGTAPGDLVGRSLLELIHPDDAGIAAELLVSIVDSCADHPGILLLRLRSQNAPGEGDVAEEWCELEVTTANAIEDPVVSGIVLNARRLTPERQRGREVSAALSSFRQAFQRSPIGMALTTLDGEYLQVNEAMCDLLRSTEEELLSKAVLETTHPDDLRPTVDAAVSLLDGITVSFSLEKRFLAADGEPVWTRATTTLLRDEDGHPLRFLTQVENIEDRRQLIEQLRLAALRDPLTGLANRAGLSEYLVSLDDAETICVIALDLDRFKAVNDRAGHAVGDEVLRVVAERIRSSIRSEDHAARTGGDEFVVVCCGVCQEGFPAMARRFVTRISEPIQVGTETVRIGASAGLATGAADRAGELMVLADQASYRSKRNGSGLML